MLRVLRVAMPPARDVSHASTAGGLLLPDGPRQGKPYRWQDDPIHLHVLRQLDAGRWDSMALVGAVQTGKSLVSILVPALRQLIHQRRAVVYAQPTQQKLHEAWTGKVSPAITGAGLGGWLPTDGQGARGGQTPRFVVFRDPLTKARAGMLYLIHGGGKNEGAQASVSAPTILIDEVDSFKSAHRISLISKRADSFGRNAVRIMTSTVKADGEPGAEDGSIILGLYQDSTRSRLHFSCLHCKAWQPLEWDRVTYDQTDEGAAADSVRYSCVKCDTAMTEEERQQMLRDSRLVHHSQTVSESGDVIGAEPRTRRFGMMWTALDSSLRDLPTLAIEHWRAAQSIARGDHGPMRSFHRDQLCRPYRGDQNLDDQGQTSIPTRNRLAALATRSDYTLAIDRREDDGDSVHLSEVPAFVEHIAVSIDVQRGGEKAPGRLYFAALGRGGGKGAVLGWGHINASPQGRQPSKAELHAALDRADGLLRDWSPSAPIVARSVDVGDRQDELIPWIRAHPDWYAIKGTGPLKATERRDRAGWLYVRQQEKPWRWVLRLIETRAALRHLHGELITGQTLLPRGVDRTSTLVRHLCATVEYAPGKWSEKPKDRAAHPEWQARDDLGQCLAYARALLYDWEQKPIKAEVVESVPVHHAPPAQSWLDGGGGSGWATNY
jgi:hypothetical protein